MRRMVGILFLSLFLNLAGIAQAGNTLPDVPTLVSVPGSAPTPPAGTLRNVGGYPSQIAGPTITPLPGGKLLVFGFDPINYGVRDEAEHPAVTLRNRWSRSHGYEFLVSSAWDALVWQPAQKAWAKIQRPPDCSGARYLHTATALPNGNVLIAGGLCDVPVFGNTGGQSPGYTKLWLWNSTTETWEAAPALNVPRIFHTATLMQDGSVLWIGGESDPALSPEGTPVLDSVETYDGKSVDRLPSLHVARARHTATLLGTGAVLVAGGIDQQGNAINSVELWDPRLRAWSVLPPLQTARYAHTATLLDDGRVMVAGGIGADGRVLDSVEFWDPATTRWSLGSPLPRPARHQAVMKLPNGNVLLVGGESRFTDASTDWALLWDKFNGTWRPAGIAKPEVADDLAYAPTLVPSDDGSVLIFAARHILQWLPVASVEPSGQPRWRSATAMAALNDGDVMVIGETDSNKWTANIWHSRDNSWTFAGDLAYRLGNYTRAVRLPTGQVMHVGLGGYDDVFCEISDIQYRHWTDCGHLSLKHRSDSPIGLETLPNGRTVLIANAADAFLYDPNTNQWTAADLEWSNQDMAYGAPVRPRHPLARLWDGAHDAWLDVSGGAAQYWGAASGHYAYNVVIGREVKNVPSRAAPPALLWDANQQQWVYVFPPGAGKMGSKVQLLPDGCAISWSPLNLFNPETGAVTALNDPGIGIQASEGSMLVLADGTAVFAGIADGGVGSGFFHRKVSCAGFAAEPENQLLMPGVFVPQAHAPGFTAAVPVPQAKAMPPRSRASLLRDYLTANPWPLRVILGVPLLYVLLRYLFLPAVRYLARRNISPRRRASLTRELPRPYAWGTRIVIYGLLALVCFPALKGFLHFRHGQAMEECKHAASACVDPHTGILQGIPELERASPDHPQPTIPCRFVGIWASRQGSLTFRITLNDDGTYWVQPNAASGLVDSAGDSGYWMVQGSHMVWRDRARPGLGPDINPILSESDGRFVLMERNGRHTQFEWIKDVAGSRCEKQDERRAAP